MARNQAKQDQLAGAEGAENILTGLEKEFVQAAVLADQED